MQLLQISPNLPQRFQNDTNPLIIRINLNHLDAAHPYKNVYLKEKKDLRTKSRPRSLSKRRSPSMKMFVNAHITSENQTYLNQTQSSKKSNDLRSSEEGNKAQIRVPKDKKQKILRVNLGLKKGNSKGKLSSESEMELKELIEKVSGTETEGNQQRSELMGEITRIIFAETENYMDKEFELVDESSIHGEECVMVEIGGF